MPSARASASSASASTLLGIGHLLAARGERERAAELVDDDADARRRGRVALGQRGFEIGVGLGGAVPERDRLLHLEVERHPAVVDPAAVLDRHEREEAEELARPALLLLRGQRCGAEAGQRLVERGARLLVGGLVARERSRGKRLRSRVEAGRCGRSALLAVGRREDAGVSGRQRRLARRPRREPALDGLIRRLERGVQASLVGVEQVGTYRRQRDLGRGGPACERPERQRRVGSRAGEARRLAELPHEQPGARGGDVTSRRGGGNGLVGSGVGRPSAPRPWRSPARRRSPPRWPRRRAPLRREGHRRLRAQRAW